MSINPIGSTPWIKICGFTNARNALDCANLGPDAIGLVFFDKSPRNVSTEQAARITAVLPGSVMPVGVFVDKGYDEIMQISEQCSLRGVQLHGSEPPELVARLANQGLVVIKALFAKKQPFLDQAAAYETASFLLVEYGKGKLPGGNAESWDYEIALDIKTGMKTDRPVIIAGGLNPGTISDAIKKARPAGVDVSSGVELAYGVKDIKKVKIFMERVSAACGELAPEQFYPQY